VSLPGGLRAFGANPPYVFVDELRAKMTETYSVRLVGGEEGERATFEFDEAGDRCLLVCRYRDRTISSEESDYFEALVAIRRQLQADGLVPYCYGASLNVFPSGMGRDMGRGLKAYKMVRGKHARLADLVEIFDEGPDIVPAKVEAQEKFFRDWLASIRS
jgi:hypothetical protein